MVIQLNIPRKVKNHTEQDYLGLNRNTLWLFGLMAKWIYECKTDAGISFRKVNHRDTETQRHRHRVTLQ